VGWRNVGLPSLAADGKTVLKNPPLALDLHYLLTAYGSTDWQAEALLGYALLMLHQNPIIARAEVSAALQALPTSSPHNPLSADLGASGLANQFEMIKITPATLGREEIAWLWTALKADYRPTFPFQVSVVLLEPQAPLSFALPVLSRNITAQAGPPAQLLQASAPSGQAAAAPGDVVTLTGLSLAGAAQIVLGNPRLGVNYPPFAPTNVTNDSITFAIPNDPANLPAGVYNLSVLFTGQRSTNTVPLPIAPSILATPAPSATASGGGTLVSLNCNPQIRPNQAAQLIMGATSVPAQPIISATANPQFLFTPALAAGSYLARLQIDGVISPVAVNWSATPPTFTGPMVNV
jgi:hypothetical protein